MGKEKEVLRKRSRTLWVFSIAMVLLVLLLWLSIVFVDQDVFYTESGLLEEQRGISLRVPWWRFLPEKFSSWGLTVNFVCEQTRSGMHKFLREHGGERQSQGYVEEYYISCRSIFGRELLHVTIRPNRLKPLYWAEWESGFFKSQQRKDPNFLPELRAALEEPCFPQTCEEIAWALRVVRAYHTWKREDVTRGVIQSPLYEDFRSDLQAEFGSGSKPDSIE